MKKILAIALGLAAVGYAGAQPKVVKSASKLAGNVDKIEEARTLIQQAMQDSETANLADTYITAAEIEWKALDAVNDLLMFNPEAPVDRDEQAARTLNGYNYYLKAIPMTLQPDQKGKVSDKKAKSIYKTIGDHIKDFWRSGVTFYTNNKYYPEAYQAFNVYADIDADPNTARPLNLQEADSLRAYSYFLSGVCAYSGEQLDKALEVLQKATQIGDNNPTTILYKEEPNAYLYQIGCWDGKVNNDSTLAEKAGQEKLEIAMRGNKKFGLSFPDFLVRGVEILHLSQRNEEAFNLVNNALSENPDSYILLGLRAWLNGVTDNDEAAEADFRAAAAKPDVDANILIKAASKLYVLGTNKLGVIEGNGAEAREARLAVKTNYFEPALEMINRAENLAKDNSELNRIRDVKGSIEYSLTTYF